MSPVNDPGGRRSPRIITPPGSIPAIGQPRNPLAPAGITPTSYSPQQLGPANLAQQGLLTQGDPGRGPGFALADHVHPAPPAPETGGAGLLIVGDWVVGFEAFTELGVNGVTGTPTIDTAGTWNGETWAPQQAGDYLVDIFIGFSTFGESSDSGVFQIYAKAFDYTRFLGPSCIVGASEYTISGEPIAIPFFQGTGLLQGLIKTSGIAFEVGLADVAGSAVPILAASNITIAIRSL